MKKIITAVAAIAMATAMFAIDFTGGVKIDGSLFDMPLKDGKVSMLKAGDGMSGGNWWGTRAQTAFYGDKGSAQFAISTNWGGAVKFNSISISFNPVDAVKVTVLNTSDKLNESYTDQKRIMYLEGAWGVAITPVDGLTINTTLANQWINNGVIGDTGVKVAYTADFGTVGAMFIGKPKAAVAASAAKVEWVYNDKTDTYEIKKTPATAAVEGKSFNEIAFGAGYAGTFDSVSMFADVAANMTAGKMTSVAFDEQVKFASDAFEFVEYASYTMPIVEGTKADYADTLLLRAKASYALDNCTPYVEVKSDDLIEKDLAMTIQPGVAFNIGCVAADIGVNVSIKKDANAISVPFAFSVGF